MEEKTSNTNEFQLSPKSLKALREWDEAHKEERERRKAENERDKAEKAGKRPKMSKERPLNQNAIPWSILLIQLGKISECSMNKSCQYITNHILYGREKYG